MHEEFYLDDHCLQRGMVETRSLQLSKQYCQFCEEFVMQHLTKHTIQNLYRKEVMNTVKNGIYSTMWHIHAVASILGAKVMSVYPQYGGFTVRKLLHRAVEPRKILSPKRYFIMWTNTRGKEVPAARWRPNHFIPVTPEPDRESEWWIGHGYVITRDISQSGSRGR